LFGHICTFMVGPQDWPSFLTPLCLGRCANIPETQEAGVAKMQEDRPWPQASNHQSPQAQRPPEWTHARCQSQRLRPCPCRRLHPPWC
jgi:hypothetical protein